MYGQRIKQVMERERMLCAPPETSVADAARRMAEKACSAVMVLQDSELAGIFTERDALNKVLAGRLDPDTTTLEQVMVRDPQTIGADKPLAYALLMMADGGFRHVPVVDATGAPVGMVSARDALGQDLVDLESDIKRMESLEGSIGY